MAQNQDTHCQDALGLCDVFILRRSEHSVGRRRPGEGWDGGMEDRRAVNRGGQEQVSGNKGRVTKSSGVSQVGSQNPALTRDHTRIHSSLDAFSSISGCSDFMAVRKRMADKLPVGQRH